MLGEDRMITGPEAGITQRFDHHRLAMTGKASNAVRLIDTAGMRRKAKVEDKLEKLSAADTQPCD